MRLRVFCLLIMVKLTAARYALLPKIIEQEGEIIVDDNKPFATVVQQPRSHTHHRRLQTYPAYQIILPAKAIQSEAPSNANENAITPTTTTTPRPPSIDGVTTGNTVYTPAEFPHDLLVIAKHKLGLRSLDEIPSISELAEFLGTNNADDTIKYIRQLTSTEQGIVLIKAYLESADYTDRTGEERRKQAAVSAPRTNSRATVEAAPRPVKPKANILERIAAYFHMYNLWPQVDGNSGNKNVEQIGKLLQPQLRRMQGMRQSEQQSARPQRPALVRTPLPFHYPIPLRPISDSSVQPPRRLQNFAPVPAHLNTPKVYVPPHIQLAKVTKIPPKQLQNLLQNKPKLAELAAKVSRFPLTNDRASLIDAQLLAAVQRAMEQDEDLKKLLSATATLK